MKLAMLSSDLLLRWLIFDEKIWTRQRNYDSNELLPSQIDTEVFWDQCQHGTWYFLPWHRGYLLALEVMLRKEIINEGGPENWSLPYWDFTQKTTLTEEGKEKLRSAKRYAPEQSYTPEAFLLPKFQIRKVESGKLTEVIDEVDNPLYIPHRYNMYDFAEKMKFSNLWKKLDEVIEYLNNLLDEKNKKQLEILLQILKDFKPVDLKEKLQSVLDALKRIKFIEGKIESLFFVDDINNRTQKALSAPSFYKECEFGGSFGGPKTGFCHGSGTLGNLMLSDVFSTHGMVENFPHDIGHIVAGGFGIIGYLLNLNDDKKTVLEIIKEMIELEQDYKDAENKEYRKQNLYPGVLTQPDTAGMDPLFYLHHVNQDRVWNSWLALPGRKNPEEKEDGVTGKAWLNGPDFNYRHFYMPMDKEQVLKYTPKDVMESSNITINCKKWGYGYDELIPFTGKTALLLEPVQTLVGSSQGSKENPLHGNFSLSVTLVQKELKEIHENERYFLDIEGVRSDNDEALLFVKVNANVENPEHVIPLFGLKNESDSSNLTGGQGMNKRLNITEWAPLLVNQPTLELEFFSAMGGNITIQQLAITKMKVKQDKSA